MAITNFQVGTSVTAAFTASAAGGTAITVIYITNKTDGDGTVDVYVTPTAVSATANVSYPILLAILVPQIK